MALTKQKKQEVVSDLENRLKDSKTVVFVNFKGLTVAEADALRTALRTAGVGYKVAKKTLLSRVLSEKGIKGDMPVLDGEIAVAYAEDLLAPAREVHAFAKGKETPSIVGGVFDGEYFDKERMLSIATIPSRDVLIAQFLNLINSPIQRFAVAVDQIAKKKTA